MQFFKTKNRNNYEISHMICGFLFSMYFLKVCVFFPFLKAYVTIKMFYYNMINWDDKNTLIIKDVLYTCCLKNQNLLL